MDFYFSMWILCSYRVSGLRDCRLQRERNLCPGKRVIVREAYSSLARRKFATIFQMCLLQENLLVIRMFDWLVSHVTFKLTSETVCFIIFLRISMWMVWIYFARGMSSLRLSRVHVWYASTHLLATACGLNSTNWSANGSNNRCSSQEQRSSYDTRIFMP